MAVLIEEFAELPFFDEEMAGALLDCLRYTQVNEGDELLQIGQVCKSIYFLEIGSVVAEWTKGKKKSICQLILPGDLSSPVKSFFIQTPSSELYVAKSDSFLSYLSFQDFTQLQANFPAFNTLLIGLLARRLIFLEEAANIMRLRRKEDRYEWLYMRRPDVFKTFSDYLICSYLGMSSVAYSSIVKIK